MRTILEYDTININGKQNVRLEFAHFSHTLHNDLWHCLKSGGFKRGGDLKGARRFCCTSLRGDHLGEGFFMLSERIHVYILSSHSRLPFFRFSPLITYNQKLKGKSRENRA